MKEIENDLKSSKSDYALSITKAMVGSIPGIGSAASEILGMIIAQPVSKRRDEWIIRLYEELKDLESRINGFKIENLKDNEQFVTVVVNAIQLVIKNNNEEKSQALKNACINTALRINSDEDKQLIFLKYIDELIPLDIKLLYHFMNPEERCKESGVNINSYYTGTPLKTFFDCNKKSNIDKELVVMRMDDLMSKKLLITFNYNANCTVQGMLSKRVSDIGSEFIEYITR